MNSSLPTVLLEFFRQPSGVALLASVGFHGVLFASLSLLPATGRPQPNLRVVSLVPSGRVQTLSPSPGVPGSSSSFDLSQFGNLPSLGNLPPLGKLPELPELPSSQSFLNLPSTGAGGSYTPGVSPLPLSSLPITTAPIRSFTPPPSPVAPPKVSTNTQTEPNPSASMGPYQDSANAQSPNYTVSTNPALPQLQPGEFGSPASPTPESTVSPTPIAPSPAPSPPASQLVTPPDSPLSSETGNAVSTLKDWLSAKGTEYGQNLIPRPARANYNYPEQACADKLTGVVVVSAVFDGEGRLTNATDNPTLVRPSGQQILDDAAIAVVKDYQADAQGQYQARTFLFDYKYSEDVCKTASTPSPEPKPDEESPVKPKVDPKGKVTPTPTPTQDPVKKNPKLDDTEDGDDKTPSDRSQPTPDSNPSGPSPEPSPASTLESEPAAPASPAVPATPGPLPASPAPTSTPEAIENPPEGPTPQPEETEPPSAPIPTPVAPESPESLPPESPEPSPQPQP